VYGACVSTVAGSALRIAGRHGVPLWPISQGRNNGYGRPAPRVKGSVIADQYSWNDHAYMRFCERIKDALDPDGILAPGKQAIWPRSMRTER